jgi:hypothetical protein
MAKDFGTDSVPMSTLGLTPSALTFASSLDRARNRLARPFFGWTSGHIRRKTRCFSRSCLRGSPSQLLSIAHEPLLLVILSGLAFFAWDEIYALLLALGADIMLEDDPGPMQAGIERAPRLALHSRREGQPHHRSNSHVGCRKLCAGKPAHNRPHISAFPVRLHRVAATLIANSPLAGRQ